MNEVHKHGRRKKPYPVYILGDTYHKTPFHKIQRQIKLICMVKVKIAVTLGILVNERVTVS